MLVRGLFDSLHYQIVEKGERAGCSRDRAALRFGIPDGSSLDRIGRLVGRRLWAVPNLTVTSAWCWAGNVSWIEAGG